ncbi:MAG: DUF6250 domain-containing protein [Acidobacteriaceae bacterium]
MKLRSAFLFNLVCLAVIVARPSSALTSQAAKVSPEHHFRIGKTLYTDDFQHGLVQWKAEEEKPGKITAANGVLDIDVPAGLTLWFKPELHGPIMISYDATVLSHGGPNDRVSDLNCFWMATDPLDPHDIFAHPRSGKFSDYNSLLTYYVGLGGRGNTTTRFRRYIGNAKVRPLLPQNDLSSPDTMIIPNQTQTIRLIADGQRIEYYRDKERLFQYMDPQPYTHGWFALRTVRNHMQIRNFRIVQLIPEK